jgi:hypothetical protein
MNPFAKSGDEVINYEFPVFPDPVRQKLEFSVSKGVYTGDFVEMQKFQKPKKEEATVVQPAIFQDFKKVIDSR